MVGEGCVERDCVVVRLRFGKLLGLEVCWGLDFLFLLFYMGVFWDLGFGGIWEGYGEVSGWVVIDFGFWGVEGGDFGFLEGYEWGMDDVIGWGGLWGDGL